MERGTSGMQGEKELSVGLIEPVAVCIHLISEGRGGDTRHCREKGRGNKAYFAKKRRAVYGRPRFTKNVKNRSSLREAESRTSAKNAP